VNEGVALGLGLSGWARRGTEDENGKGGAAWGRRLKRGEFVERRVRGGEPPSVLHGKGGTHSGVLENRKGTRASLTCPIFYRPGRNLSHVVYGAEGEWGRRRKMSVRHRG